MKRIAKSICATVISIIMVLTCMVIPNNLLTLHAEESQLIIYPDFPEQMIQDYMYEVTVTQGNTSSVLPVYNHTMESTISRNADGSDTFRRFATFAFSGEPVRVNVKVNTDFDSYSVMPSAKEFKHTYKDGVISVYLEQPDYFLIRLDDSDNTILSVFADTSENLEGIDFSAPNTIAITDWYEPEDGTGVLKITKPNTTLYIAPGAVLNARVKITADNCRVLGRGAIVDPYENIYHYDIRHPDGGDGGNGTKMISFEHCSNGIVDGVHLLDARCFNIAVSGSDCENNTIRNVKILSSMMTTDGISFFGGTGHLAEHCYIYCGDNAMVFSAKNSAYRDITIGTTCAALYPQGSPSNVTIEDIHVFRSDDGIVNQDFNTGATRCTAEVVVSRLDSVDCTYLPHFFRGRYIESNGMKHFTFTDTSIGDAKQHKTTTIFSFPNADGTLFSDNWNIELKNFALGESIISSISELAILDEGENNTIIVEKTGNFNPVTHEKNNARHTATSKVFIGSWQVYFSKPVLVENGVFYLPAEEIQQELRTHRLAATLEKNGSQYVASNTLVASGMAQAVEIKDGSLIITPVNSGQNLLVPDSGVLSHFTERDESKLHLYTTNTAEGWVYSIENTMMEVNAGIYRILNEDIKKYGVGRYRISFQAKAEESGQILVCVNTKSRGRVADTQAIGTNWQNYFFDLEVNEKMLADTNIQFYVQSANTALHTFSLRNITLQKYELVDDNWLIPEEIKGDVNTDGIFNLADVVLLQKWLLAIPNVELNDWKAADLYNDDVLNCFDFILMKKLLIANSTV